MIGKVESNGSFTDEYDPIRNIGKGIAGRNKKVFLLMAHEAYCANKNNCMEKYMIKWKNKDIKVWTEWKLLQSWMEIIKLIWAFIGLWNNPSPWKKMGFFFKCIFCLRFDM